MEANTHECCPKCGDNMYVKSSEGKFYDGDICFCFSCENTEVLSVDEYGNHWLQDKGDMSDEVANNK